MSPFFRGVTYILAPVLILGGAWGIGRGAWILSTEGWGSIGTAFAHVIRFGIVIAIGILFLKHARVGRVSHETSAEEASGPGPAR